MPVEELMTAVAAVLVTVPATLVAAHWARRSADRAAEATVAAGQGQSAAAVEVARIQELAGRAYTRDAVRRAAYTDFLRAADVLARTVGELPGTPQAERKGILDQKATAVTEALAAVALANEAEVTASAEALRQQCDRLERLALRRAVLRSALSTLYAAWCPRNPEVCDHQQHITAYLAHEQLCAWGSLGDEERWAQLDDLRDNLEDSGALSAQEVAQLLDVANSATHWNAMIGGWVRDPLLERFGELRAAFVRVACGALEERLAA
ncbi:hypothetical protein [Streptomyces sp. NPDC007369]|uniref:hypothetical protein n=1 Tax=Streptomyces sp. NPDC007369 TaxID=3154589 RepID=UPI0033FB92C8